MNNKFNIFMVNGINSYADWFPFDYSITNRKEEANVFWYEGGADIAPWIYGEKRGMHTHFSEYGSKQEVAAWEFCKDKPILKIGTCKGSQNLGCFNGGRMVQHSQHPFHHNVLTKEGFNLNCISMHHQQSILDEQLTGLKDGRDYDLLAWTEKLSPFHLDQNDKDYNFPNNYKEPEVFWFEKSLSYCVQSHPEAMNSNSSFVKYCQSSLIEKLKQVKFI